jgi:mRNA interferase MazF
MEKDFAGWHKLKTELQSKKLPPVFREREIWWCNIGVNIGDEEDGKSEFFSRPVLIIHKFNQKIFWGIPLTTQVKDNPNYHKISFKDKTQCVMLTQLKLFDAKRLTRRIGKITSAQENGVKTALHEIIS